MIALPQPRWMYQRSRQMNAVKNCRECEGTGTYSPGLDPQWDRDCPVCRGEGVMDSVLFHDPLNIMHQNRKGRLGGKQDKYARARAIAMRPSRLPNINWSTK